MEKIPRHITNAKKELIIIILQLVFTTFVFAVEEVIKGNHIDDQIKVLALGGCVEAALTCAELSFKYDYKISKSVVLFLKFNEFSKSF